MNEYEHKQAFDDRFQYLKKRKKWISIATLLAVVAFFAVFYYALVNKLLPLTIMAFIVGLPAIGMLGKQLKPINEELKSLSSYAAGVILKSKLSSVEIYDPFSVIDENVVRRLQLPVRWDGGKGSDLVQGAYRNIPLCFSDVELTKTVSSPNGGDTHKTVFKGQVFTLGLVRPVQGSLWIGKVPMLPLRGFDDKLGMKIEGTAGLEKQSIYTSDSEVAQEILTADYVSRLCEAFERAGDKLYLYFDKDTLYGALHSKSNMFEGKGSMEWEALIQHGSQELDELLGLFDCLTDNSALFARADKT